MTGKQIVSRGEENDKLTSLYALAVLLGAMASCRTGSDGCRKATQRPYRGRTVSAVSHFLGSVA